MSVTLLFTAHNRLAFVQASFDALLEHTDWTLVDRLIVLDDASTDGTAEWLAAKVRDFYGRTGIRCDYETAPFGGPVAAMNRALDLGCASVLAKIDSDVIVCPGWLDAMLEPLRNHPHVDALGMEPDFGETVAPVDELRSVLAASHIGGVGLIRTRVFASARPRPTSRFGGWTEFQERHVTAGWVTPDLPVFLLDHLPFEPWRSLAREYVARGWSRAWPAYPERMESYWAWWSRAHAEAAA